MPENRSSPDPNRCGPRNQDEPWYEDGLRFACTACGDCCAGGSGYVWVTPKEAAGLAAAVGQSLPAFANAFLRTVNGRLSLRESPGGDCLLLDPGSRRCRAYAHRPRQCRTYPFWPGIVATPETWDNEARECPGIGGDTVVPAAEISAFADQPGGSGDA